MAATGREALIVIDVQNDYLPGGRLPVPECDVLISLINRLGKRFEEVVLTQDWHPHGHISFASTHGMQPFSDTVEATYGTQSLWPDHTIQGETGAAFPPTLDLPHASLIIRKGFRQHMDSYSAFLENDHQTSTGLAGYLRDRGVHTLYLCGLATDYCVGFSALDGKALGFDVFVIEDAIRGITRETSHAMTQRWQTAGVHTLKSFEFPTGK